MSQSRNVCDGPIKGGWHFKQHKPWESHTYQPIPQYFHQWWRRKVEKGDTGRKEAIEGKAGHGSEQTARTQKKTVPKQRKVAPIQKSALLCPAYLTEVLQPSHTSLLVTDDSAREQGCFSMLLLLLLALPSLGERQGGGRVLGLPGILPGRWGKGSKTVNI